MQKTLTILCLTIVALLGSIGMSWSADFQKGLTAAFNGDYATALREWKPLAEQGNADAQYNLGFMYDKGRGIPQDYKTAVKWYKLSAEQGDADAQTNLGFIYEKGLGVPQDYKIAVRWYILSAEQGNADAQYNLGLMYGTGLGVTQDNIYAHMWWSVAELSGNKSASKNKDIIAKRMNSNQIEKAQEFARECVRKKYKGC